MSPVRIHYDHCCVICYEQMQFLTVDCIFTVVCTAVLLSVHMFTCRLYKLLLWSNIQTLLSTFCLVLRRFVFLFLLSLCYCCHCVCWYWYFGSVSCFFPRAVNCRRFCFWRRQFVVFVCVWNVSGTAEQICPKLHSLFTLICSQYRQKRLKK